MKVTATLVVMMDIILQPAMKHAVNFVFKIILRMIDSATKQVVIVISVAQMDIMA